MNSTKDTFIGHKLKEIRIENGYSQQEIGDILNVSFQQIQKYEQSNNRISLASICEISKIIDIDLNSFKGGNGDIATNLYEKKPKETITLLRTYYSLPKNIRNKVLNLLKSIAK